MTDDVDSLPLFRAANAVDRRGHFRIVEVPQPKRPPKRRKRPAKKAEEAATAPPANVTSLGIARHRGKIQTLVDLFYSTPVEDRSRVVRQRIRRLVKMSGIVGGLAVVEAAAIEQAVVDRIVELNQQGGSQDHGGAA